MDVGEIHVRQERAQPLDAFPSEVVQRRVGAVVEPLGVPDHEDGHGVVRDRGGDLCGQVEGRRDRRQAGRQDDQRAQRLRARGIGDFAIGSWGSFQRHQLIGIQPHHDVGDRLGDLAEPVG